MQSLDILYKNVKIRYDLNPQIWFGDTVPTQQGFKPIQNEHFIKPLGGLWTSTLILDDEYICDWERWCDHETDFCYDKQAYMIIPKRDLNIIEIDSLNDLVRVLHYFILRTTKEYASYYFTCIDYEKILSSGFDAIHLTERGQGQTHLSEPNLYGWDCESTLWLRWSFSEVYTTNKGEGIKKEEH